MTAEGYWMLIFGLSIAMIVLLWLSERYGWLDWLENRIEDWRAQERDR